MTGQPQPSTTGATVPASPPVDYGMVILRRIKRWLIIGAMCWLAAWSYNTGKREQALDQREQAIILREHSNH